MKYRFKGVEYDMDSKGMMAVLISAIGQEQLISRNIEDVDGELIINYFNNTGVHIGTSKDVHHVLRMFVD